MKRLAAIFATLGITFVVSVALFRYASQSPADVFMMAPDDHMQPQPAGDALESTNLTTVTGEPTANSGGTISADVDGRLATSIVRSGSRPVAPRSQTIGQRVEGAGVTSPEQPRAENPSGEQASHFSPPTSIRSARPKVALPVAFQDVDLFIQTPQGLRYAPVNYQSGASPTPAASKNATPGAPGTLVVDEAAAAKLDQMRQDFVKAVGGLNQDPSDPAYEQRWKQAQKMSDQHFRAQYGAMAFQRYQLAAAQKAESDRQAAAQH